MKRNRPASILRILSSRNLARSLPYLATVVILFSAIVEAEAQSLFAEINIAAEVSTYCVSIAPIDTRPHTSRVFADKHLIAIKCNALSALEVAAPKGMSVQQEANTATLTRQRGLTSNVLADVTFKTERERGRVAEKITIGTTSTTTLLPPQISMGKLIVVRIMPR